MSEESCHLSFVNLCLYGWGNERPVTATKSHLSVPLLLWGLKVDLHVRSSECAGSAGPLGAASPRGVPVSTDPLVAAINTLRCSPQSLRGELNKVSLDWSAKSWRWCQQSPCVLFTNSLQSSAAHFLELAPRKFLWSNIRAIHGISSTRDTFHNHYLR